MRQVAALFVRADSLTFGSVCSGIEAASVAFGHLSWRAAWFSEIEAFPSAVLAHHYLEVPNLGDMTALIALLASGEAEAPDILCGGTPCQAFSVAGNRQSLADARGNLTLTFCEIADAIDAVRRDRGDEPCVVFWENVPGVLSTADNAFGCFLGALVGAGAALVPGRKQRWTDAGVVAGPRRVAAWRVLDAQHFGLAQRRRRVFVVSSAREGFDPAAVLFERKGVRGHPAPGRGARQDVAPTVAGGARSRGGYSTDDIPLTARSVALRGREGGGTAELGDDRANALRASSGGGDKPHVLAFGGNNTAGPIDVATAVRAKGGTAMKQGMAVRRLTPVETERLQGMPDNYTAIPWRGRPASECPDGPRYRSIGNSMAVPVVRWIGDRIAHEAEA